MQPRDVTSCGDTAVAGLISEQSECYASPPTELVFWGQNMGRGGAMLTPNELFLTFGGCYLCATFGE